MLLDLSKTIFNSTILDLYMNHCSYRDHGWKIQYSELLDSRFLSMQEVSLGPAMADVVLMQGSEGAMLLWPQ